MINYRHDIALIFKTREQFNRHAAHLINQDGFISCGESEPGIYGFSRDVEKDEYERLIQWGRRPVVYEEPGFILKVAKEEKRAW